MWECLGVCGGWGGLSLREGEWEIRARVLNKVLWGVVGVLAAMLLSGSEVSW